MFKWVLVLAVTLTTAAGNVFAQEAVPGVRLFTNDVATNVSDPITVENEARFKCYEYPLYCVYKRNKRDTQYLMNVVLRTVFGRNLLDPVTEFYIDPEYGPDELFFAYYKNSGGPMAVPDPADLVVMDAIKRTLIRHDRNELTGPRPEKVKVNVKIMAIQESHARNFHFGLSSLMFGIGSGDDDYSSRKSYDGQLWSLGMNTTSLVAALDWRNKSGMAQEYDEYDFVIENGSRLNGSDFEPVYREFNSSVAEPDKQNVGMHFSGRPRIQEADGAVRFEGLHFELGFLSDPVANTVQQIETHRDSPLLYPGETYIFWSKKATVRYKGKDLGFLEYGRDSRLVESKILVMITVDILSPDGKSGEIDQNDLGLAQLLTEEERDALPLSANAEDTRKLLLSQLTPVVTHSGIELFYTFKVDKDREYVTQNVLSDRVQVEAWIDVDARADKEDWKHWMPARVRTIEELIVNPDVALASSSLPDKVFDQEELEENSYPVRISLCPIQAGECNEAERVVHELSLNPKRAVNGFYLVR